MDNYKKIKEKILNMVEQLKNKNILVEVDFHENRNKFSVSFFANSSYLIAVSDIPWAICTTAFGFTILLVHL